MLLLTFRGKLRLQFREIGKLEIKGAVLRLKRQKRRNRKKRSRRFLTLSTKLSSKAQSLRYQIK